PDLHTAAHEAAHVVQQRAGVHLSGGVGAAGDSHERHADAVADRVVRGESAVDLLDQVAPRGAAGQGDAVQRQEAPASSPRQDAFSRIHFFMMSALLRALEPLRPFTGDDYELARRHFGPRLVVAMKTVQTRAPWGSGELSALPADQQRDIQSYLGVSNMLPEGDAGFAQVWNAHPHDYKSDPAQNTSSEEVRGEHGLPAAFQNTCACRLSVMLNATGNPITPASVKAAGISRAPFYSEKTRQYYIIAANEMWAYLSKHFRGPDVVFPARGEYRSSDEFNAAFTAEILPVIASRKGIVAFETIFGYSGTGHVDVFDGVTLSDSSTWYACRRLRLWFVAV
ncbi:MAG TPA: T6SS effector amidase Tae4 family protein, partial [Kofleriaceae bacterium]|nr:T6SS effector amidase Tae4 family protein [Kofleriaceae bacterium]